MNLKEIIKPNAKKIILAVVLLFFFSLPAVGSASISYGFPFAFYESHWGLSPTKGAMSSNGVSYLGGIFDVIFWYLISGFLLGLIAVIKSRKKS